MNASVPLQLDYVFAGAHAHVRDWPAKHWHSGIAHPHSSQALCLSVWGTLATHRRRTAIVTDILTTAGLDVGPLRAPVIQCEAGADRSLERFLNETGGQTTPTCVDALLEWPGGVVTVESKFTEPSFGACSQVSPRTDIAPRDEGERRMLPAACSGRYGIGSDRKTETRAPCRLQTWDGNRAPRLYWQLAWELFEAKQLRPDGRPCPFAGPNFQLMRNLALARAKAAPRSRRTDPNKAPAVAHREWGMLVAHVGAHPNAEAHRREFGAFCELLLDDVRPRVGLIEYEQIVEVLRSYALGDLARDVERRIALAPSAPRTPVR